jgi:acyl carrier protein
MATACALEHALICRLGGVRRQSKPDPLPGVADVRDSNPASSSDGSLAEVLAIVGVVLQRSDVEAASNFFDLDGTSLAALEIVGKLEERFGAVVSLADLLDADDMVAIAKLIDAESPSR